MNALQNRVALVTGSSRGIGAGIAELFAAEGARVVLHGRDVEALESVRAKISAAGGEVLALTADLTRFEEIEALRLRVEESFGPVDVLVTNAGGNPVRPGPIEEITEEGWRAGLDANLTSTFLTVKSFLPGMKARGHGSIVTLSSAAARRPTAQTPFGYAAAKAGVELLTQGLALQAGPHGVRVNCLAPETILTERNMRQIPAEVQRTLVDAHPVRRLGTPEDVAQAALFLAAESASWISGVVLDVAGGSVLA
ncbi:SDR family NAD(P)-dependent oxidoreductase [Streptacidiphilus jiangxiensis]|uniref:3-oxoacyl-[acyl-carrier protein] reductase n=1 Tax=Streptacidiphilus jiangxiensis TaxID=235985 RepID=A0A1H7UQ57_STRJI|nr:SDR family NAD(P)-dependent oxidoreductase [Streptacidiphilus jiangxiensis]SEL99150.1 3-oxoacyl-[acyl-carrier protein] reductase [Streptacidiphilus jiangxiensis]